MSKQSKTDLFETLNKCNYVTKIFFQVSKTGDISREQIDEILIREFPSSLLERANATFQPCVEKYGNYLSVDLSFHNPLENLKGLTTFQLEQWTQILRRIHYAVLICDIY